MGFNFFLSVMGLELDKAHVSKASPRATPPACHHCLQGQSCPSTVSCLLPSHSRTFFCLDGMISSRVYSRSFVRAWSYTFHNFPSVIYLVSVINLHTQLTFFHFVEPSAETSQLSSLWTFLWRLIYFHFMYIGICVLHSCLVPEVARRVADPLELEFHLAVSDQMGARNRTWVLGKSSEHF